MFRNLIRREWILSTLLAIIAVAVMVRLGFWQLDRLEKRREFNARVTAQVESPPLVLQGNSLPEDLSSMEYRHVTVYGEYDTSQEVALRNQVHNDQAGVHLITPLLIEDSDLAVMVDRGWIPLEDFKSGDWDKYSENGKMKVEGIIRASQAEPDVGIRTDPIPAPGEWVSAWNFANIDAMDKQISHRLLSIYIQQSPENDRIQLPARSQPDLELTEGPHLGYAVQWFIFAAILAIGYPIYVRKETVAGGSEKPHSNAALSTPSK